MADESGFGLILLDIYRPRFQARFANHPNGKEIVEMLCNGGNPPELVTLWFAEAESYDYEAMGKAAANGGKVVKFAVIKGDN